MRNDPLLRGIGIVLLATASCARESGSEDSASPADRTSATAPANATEKVPEHVVERGPVRVTVSLDPPSPRLSDEVRFTLEVDAEEGVTLTLPPFADSFGDFTVLDFDEDLPEHRNGRNVQRQHYRLEPNTVGTTTLPSVPLEFQDDRPQGDGQSHEIQSESFEVEVTSLLGGEAPSLKDLRPPAPPVELPPEPGISPFSPRYLIGGAAALVAVVGLALLLRRRSRTPPPPPTATELAERELDALARAGHLERGELQSWFVELTLIVRRFVERTHGIRAPEQTTEEFLRAARSHPALREAESLGLESFLESADLVKFAAVRPEARELAEAEQRARRFVGLGSEGRAPRAPGAPS